MSNRIYFVCLAIYLPEPRPTLCSPFVFIVRTCLFTYLPSVSRLPLPGVCLYPRGSVSCNPHPGISLHRSLLGPLIHPLVNPTNPISSSVVATVFVRLVMRFRQSNLYVPLLLYRHSSAPVTYLRTYLPTYLPTSYLLTYLHTFRNLPVDTLAWASVFIAKQTNHEF